MNEKDKDEKLPEEKETPEKQEKEPAKDAEKPGEKPAPKEKQPEVKPKPAAPEPKPDEEKPEQAEKPDDGELSKLKAENLRLTTQLEAIKAGFSPDLTEEAVLLAENIAAKEGCDIKTALGKVAEKFPEWKKTADERKKEKKGGIKVGAPGSDKPPEQKPRQPTAQKRWNRFN